METRSLVIVSERVLYRYTDERQYAEYEGYRRPFLNKFEIVKETEKSYIIRIFLGGTRRVLKTGKNIFAWDTEEKALFNYFKRKEKQEAIYEQKFNETKRNLRWAEEELEKRRKWKEENPTSALLKEVKC